MNRKVVLHLFYRYLLSGLLLMSSSIMANSTTREVEINFQLRERAIYYQIEWLNKDQVTVDKDNVQSSPIRKSVARDVKYFKIRSVMNGDIAGPWGEIVDLEKYLSGSSSTTSSTTSTTDTTTDSNSATTTTKDGVFTYFTDKTKANSLPFLLPESLSKNDLGDFDSDVYYSLNGSRPLKLFDEPLNFDRTGKYTLSLYNNSEPTKESHIETRNFMVDRTPPNISARFMPPFYGHNSLIYLGQSARVDFNARDNMTGIDKIFFRLRPGYKEKAFMTYRGEIRARHLVGKVEQKALFEYFAVDKAGNRSINRGVEVFVDTLAPRIDDKQTKIGAKTMRLYFPDTSVPVEVEIFSQGKQIKKDKVYNLMYLDIKDIPGGERSLTIKTSDYMLNTSEHQMQLPEIKND